MINHITQSLDTFREAGLSCPSSQPIRVKHPLFFGFNVASGKDGVVYEILSAHDGAFVNSQGNDTGFRSVKVSTSAVSAFIEALRNSGVVTDIHGRNENTGRVSLAQYFKEQGVTLRKA